MYGYWLPLWCLQTLLFNHYPIEDRFAESALGANQQSFRFGQFTDEQMLEKPETTMRNKESRDIGRIGEIKKEKQIKTKNKKKQTNKQANKQTKQKTKQNKTNKQNQTKQIKQNKTK